MSYMNITELVNYITANFKKNADYLDFIEFTHKNFDNELIIEVIDNQSSNNITLVDSKNKIKKFKDIKSVNSQINNCLLLVRKNFLEFNNTDLNLNKKQDKPSTPKEDIDECISKLKNIISSESNVNTQKYFANKVIDKIYHTILFPSFNSFDHILSFLSGNNFNSEKNSFYSIYIKSNIWYEYSNEQDKEKFIIFIQQTENDKIFMFTLENNKKLKATLLYKKEELLYENPVFNDFRDVKNPSIDTARRFNYSFGLDDARTPNYCFFINKELDHVKDACLCIDKINQAHYLLSTLEHSLSD